MVPVTLRRPMRLTVEMADAMTVMNVMIEMMVLSAPATEEQAGRAVEWRRI
jgi:hypothetical protein